MDLRTTTSRVGDRLVVALDGSADLATAPRLDSQLRAAVAQHPAATLHVDLDGLIALDDIALGVLLGVAGTARSGGGELVVVCSDATRRARLQVTGFTRAVNVVTSVSAQRSGDPLDTGVVAVIFTSLRTAADPEGYAAAAALMESTSSTQAGFLGIESTRGDDGLGITVSYWRSAEHARAWKRNSEHLLIQRTGRERWYEWYRVRIATVERAYAYASSDVSTDEDTMNETYEILHLALPDDWDTAKLAGEYTVSTRGLSLQQEGFIHCSYPNQLEGVANRFYSDLAELLILRIDTDLLEAEVKVEPAIEGGTDLFPHVYGPIPISAVIATNWWDRSDDGLWHRPSML